MQEEKEKSVKRKRKSTVIYLDYPVEWGDEEITKIEIKKPKGKHVKSLGTDIKVSDLIRIAQKCSEYPMAVFDEMDGSDVFKIAEAVGEML